MTIPEEIEELKTRLAQTSDAYVEAELILKLLAKYSSIRSTDSKPFIDRLLRVADKIPGTGKRYRAWALINLCNFHNINGNNYASLNFAQQALSIFEEIKDKEGLARTYNNIGISYSLQGNLAEALKNYFMAIHLMEELGDKKAMATPFANIGVIYERQGNYSESLKNQLQALQIRKELDNNSGMAESYNSIGVIHSHQGNYPEALNNYLQALRINQEMGDKLRTAGVYTNIGIIYQHQHNYNEALKNYMHALKIVEEFDNKLPIAETCSNIGIIQTSIGNYQEAMRNHQYALQIGQDAGDRGLMSHAYANIGDVWYYEGNYPGAVKNYLMALSIMEEIGNKSGIIGCYIGLGKVYEKQGSHADAIQNELLAYQLSEKIADKNLIKESSLALSKAYKTVGDFENALKYHEKYHRVEGEMLGEQAQKQLTSLSFMHNLEQKEREAVFEKEKREEADRFRKIVEIKNTEIIQSINYASKIQSAILPPLDAVKKQLPDSFVLHLSKDIVSGDFYFLEANNDYIYIAVVDCTGHGVPGAMVSIVGHAGLKRTIDEFKLNQPADILLKLNELVAGTLHQSDMEDAISDGMDIALCRIDLKNKQLLYAGANRPLWLFREGRLTEYKPTKTAIGGMKYEQDRHKQFMQEEIALLPGDTFYIFSDGYADQFGGENGKKMMIKKFKETLRSVQDKPMPEQQNDLIENFKAWKGENEQVDDVLVIGIRI